MSEVRREVMHSRKKTNSENQNGGLAVQNERLGLSTVKIYLLFVNTINVASRWTTFASNEALGRCYTIYYFCIQVERSSTEKLVKAGAQCRTDEASVNKESRANCVLELRLKISFHSFSAESLKPNKTLCLSCIRKGSWNVGTLPPHI
jgi:hypothetical protein